MEMHEFLYIVILCYLLIGQDIWFKNHLVVRLLLLLFHLRSSAREDLMTACIVCQCVSQSVKLLVYAFCVCLFNRLLRAETHT